MATTMLGSLLLRCGVAAVILLACGCVRLDDSDLSVSHGIVQHPVAESIPGADDVAHVISSAGPILDEEVGALVDRLARSSEILSVGALEGDAYEMFGNIQDLAVDAEDNLYVLDARNAVVRVFDPQGTYVRDFGERGGGPGEFRAPNAIAIDAANRLLVADQARRITAFDLVRGNVDTTMALPGGPRDLCVSATRIYIHGVTVEQEGVLHAFDAAGTYLHSFGSGYQFGGLLAREGLSRGSLTCSRQTDDTMFLLRFLPVVRGYSPQGESKWVSRLSDFDPMRITEDANTQSLTYSGRDGISDVMHHATVIDGTGYVLVQVLRRNPETVQQRREYAEMLTYVMSMETGAGGYAGNELPPVYAIAAGRIYTAVNWPYPRIRIYELPSANRPGV